MTPTCSRGHPSTPANRYTDPTGHTSCRVCRRETTADRKRQRRKGRRSSVRGVHLPFAPLKLYLLTVTGADASAAVWAGLCGVDRRVWLRWQAEGVPVFAADRAAVALGRHPLEIWPEFTSVDAAA